MDVKLRAAAPSDREFVESTYFTTQRWIIEKLFGWRGDDFERAKFVECYNQRNSNIIVLNQEDVGWLAVERSPSGIELGHIYIVPTKQRRGIGTELIRGLIDEATQIAMPLRLSTAKINPAVHLYERLGFRVTREDEYKCYMEFSL